VAARVTTEIANTTPSPDALVVATSCDPQAGQKPRRKYQTCLQAPHV
jgi:hypothetical protein